MTDKIQVREDTDTFTKYPDWLWTSGLNMAEREIYLTIKSFDRRNGNRKIKQATLAAKAGCHLETLQRHAKSLEDKGWITREQHCDKETGIRISTIYTLYEPADYRRPSRVVTTDEPIHKMEQTGFTKAEPELSPEDQAEIADRLNAQEIAKSFARSK